MMFYLKHLASKREGRGAVRVGGGPDDDIAGHKSKPATFITSISLTPAAEREISFI